MSQVSQARRQMEQRMNEMREKHRTNLLKKIESGAISRELGERVIANLDEALARRRGPL